MAKKAAAKTAVKKPRKKKSEEGAAVEANAIWMELSEKLGADKPQPYRMNSTYTVNTLIEHPKFGLGYVISALPGRIDVAFRDANRALVHSRQ
jgi:hypothetical protein